MLELGLKVFLSYVIGSLNGALLIGKLYGGVDIRKVGSGNAGGTNALRTQGKLFAFFVMLVDVGKGVVPVLLFPTLVIFGIGNDPEVARSWLTYACGAAAIFGHCFPVWFDFAGGKGAATTLGVLAGVAPQIIPVAGMAWLAALLLGGYVGLATVVAAFAMPVAVAVIDGQGNQELVIFSIIVAFFITFTHRSNLRKLFAGNASRDIGFSLFGGSSRSS